MKKLLLFFLHFPFVCLSESNNHLKGIEELNKISKIVNIYSINIYKNVNKPIKSDLTTLLMLAAEKNYINLVKYLLSLGADHLIKNKQNLTAYDIAKKENNLEIVRLLTPKDVTFVGLAKFNDGLGRTPVGLVESLYKDVTIDFINPKTKALLEEQSHESTIEKNIINILSNDINKFNKVIFFTDLLSTKPFISKLVHYSNRIKIAFSVFETSKIPDIWVQYLNYYFDLAIVADEYYVKVYQDSGVNIPVFALPHGVYLDDFLKLPHKTEKNKVFTFGCLSSIDNRKNQKLLVQAFIEEFKKKKNVRLKINGRYSKNADEIKKLIDAKKVNNVEISHENLPWDQYIKYMSSFDCYVNISKGEGFSVTPREALALGIPCIVTNNTAQQTICDSGFACSVPSNILEKAYYTNVYNIGNFFNCHIKDVRKALRDVYENYDYYLTLAHKGREWVKKYQWSNLRQRFLNFIKPQKIIFGNQNKITNKYLMTNSEKLYNKYVQLIGDKI